MQGLKEEALEIDILLMLSAFSLLVTTQRHIRTPERNLTGTLFIAEGSARRVIREGSRITIGFFFFELFLSCLAP